MHCVRSNTTPSVSGNDLVPFSLDIYSVYRIRTTVVVLASSRYYSSRVLEYGAPAPLELDPAETPATLYPATFRQSLGTGCRCSAGATADASKHSGSGSGSRSKERFLDNGFWEALEAADERDHRPRAR